MFPFKISVFRSFMDLLEDSEENALEALKRLKAPGIDLPLGQPKLDGILSGGFTPGVVYEIVGEAGTGKTRIIYTLVTNTLLLRPTSTCVWLDSNRSCRTTTIVQMAKQRQKVNPDEFLENLLLTATVDTEQLIRALERVVELCLHIPPVLVVIDSVYLALHDTSYTLYDGGFDTQRTVLKLLHEIADFGVVVITINGITERNGYVKPMLGKVWFNGIKHRISLTTDGTLRSMKIVAKVGDSDVLGTESEALFKITDAGVVDHS